MPLDEGDVRTALLACLEMARRQRLGQIRDFPDNAPMRTEVLTTKQAADRLGLSQQRIQQLIAVGKLPAQMLGGNYIVYADDLAGLKIYRKPGRPKKPDEETLAAVAETKKARTKTAAEPVQAAALMPETKRAARKITSAAAVKSKTKKAGKRAGETKLAAKNRANK